MDLIKAFRISVGVLLLVSTITVFFLLFLEPEVLAVMFNFSIDITAGNLGEVIAGAVVGLMAGLAFLIGMFIVGIFNFIVYSVIGSLVLALKRSKTMVILTVILTAFALFLEIRGLVLISIGGFNSIILILRIISDTIIIAFSIYIFLQILKNKEEIPRG